MQVNAARRLARDPLARPNVCETWISILHDEGITLAVNRAEPSPKGVHMTDNEATTDIVISTPPRQRSRARRVLIFIAAYFGIAIVALPYVVPPFPTSTARWLLLFVCLPPLYVLGEWLGEQVARPWGERTWLSKLAKGGVLVVVMLLLLAAQLILAGSLNR